MGSKKHFNNHLLVEGNDDQHVLWALCEKYKITENFDVIDCKGIDPLFNQIPTRLKESGLKTLGIIIDADENLASRWRRVIGSLTHAFPNLPLELPVAGLIHSENALKIGVWIMPDNSIEGRLEDFIRTLVPREDKLMPVINEYLSSIEEKGLNKYSDIHRSKAKIHSWLAVQEDPGTPLGLSITKKYLLDDDSKCQSFLDWLDLLFTN